MLGKVYSKRCFPSPRRAVKKDTLHLRIASLTCLSCFCQKTRSLIKASPVVNNLFPKIRAELIFVHAELWFNLLDSL